RDLERVGDLGVREPDDIAQEQRHLEVDAERLDGAPDRVDRLCALERLVDHLERWNVVERDHRAGATLERAQRREHAGLGQLEQAGREPGTKREPRQAMEDAEEDLLRQVLGQGAVADEAQDVVEDGLLVGADDQGERALVAALGFAKDPWIRLYECQPAASVAPRSEKTKKIYQSVSRQSSSGLTPVHRV